ncbi:transposase [Haloimpatiens lingqiaonensis]|uniref:transposase n=1 Tax=Haloimpatiens lingqiaonensis TaxID=1380675 RepID=UPI001FAA544C|nr:transposase [Haloimpatiens lingqiaonensis]
MARGNRIKKDDAIYHVMIRSISEVPLFKKDRDKDIYLEEMKKRQEMHKFKVYAYCLMTNHAHFMIDANGADISKIMHGLNHKYAITFNRLHKRHGHLFQDRFKSKIVDTDRYLVVLSAYIHNNPLKIKGYEYHLEEYKYSSLKVYLGLEKDKTGLLDEDYVMKFFGSNVQVARENYMKFVYVCDYERLKKEMEFEDEKTEYRSEKTVLVRDFDPDKIMEFVAEETGTKKVMLYIKNSKNTKVARALAALLMRCLCDFKCSDICKILGNITQSRVSKLCSIGVELISTEDKYRNIIEKFISKYQSHQPQISQINQSYQAQIEQLQP